MLLYWVARAANYTQKLGENYTAGKMVLLGGPQIGLLAFNKTLLAMPCSGLVKTGFIKYCRYYYKNK